VFPVRYELNIYVIVEETRPPLWSSGQSSCLQEMYCGSYEIRTEYIYIYIYVM
jgi:hypothetical protein